MCLIKYYRNISISAHIDAGKTTTTERILYYTGKKHKIGEVHNGEATMDWMPQEQERGITITSACTTVFWKDMLNKYPLHRINIIDTPGHVDFTIEVERSMRVIDAVCMIYCSVAGIQSQSETVWRQANKHKIPKLIFVNKMDRLGADFFKIYNDLKSKLNANPVVLFIPYIINNNFLGVIDLLKFKLIIWDEFSKGMKYSYHEIPDEFLKITNYWKEKIIDIILEDNYLADKYLNNLFISEISLIKFLRKKTIDCVIQPMLCGSSFKNKGVQCLLDSIVNFLPSPLDFVKIEGYSISGEQIFRNISKEEKFSALAFKIMSDPFVGQLVFFRVYSGVLKCNDFIFNSTKLKKERVGRILHIYANNREDVKSVAVGDIAAAVGLKTVTTGDTLCDIKNPIIFEKIFFPEPVISQSIELRNKSDQDKIIVALNKLMREDPSFTSHVDPDSNQTIISGMGELHLEILVDRIKREFGLELIVGKPKVSYKETIKSSAFNIEGKYIRQSGGRGQYGHVVINVEPNSKGQGYKFLDEIKGGIIPKEYIIVIDRSIKNTLSNGILLGYPVLDIIVHLVNGSYHDVDSSENAFKIAASLAIKSAVRKANPILLEPLMSVTIEIPEFYLGVVVGDISSKRGFLEGIEDSCDGLKILKSIIPLSEMFGYSTNLRSLSQGRGTFSMLFKEYREVPKSIFDSII